jgi:hypothetical protein
MTPQASKAAAVLVWAAAALPFSPEAPSVADQGTSSVVAPCASLDAMPVVEQHYTLNARVRLLLVWIQRSNVGGARLAWSREAGDARRFELLIGSDPRRAPMRINRWGYLAETVCGTSARLVGVMTETTEQSTEQARLAHRTDGRYAFNAIRSNVVGSEATGAVTRFLLAENLTYRDVGTLLRRRFPDDVVVRRLRLPAGTEPGFLAAVAALLRRSVDTFNETGRVATGPGLRRFYTYNAQLYEATLRSSKFIAHSRLNGEDYPSIIESEFEIRNLTSRGTTAFRVTYGTQRALAGVPIRIVFRPKWWFEAELLRERRSVL